MKGVILCLLLIASVLAQKKPVKGLPGYNGPTLNQYTGYITVNEKNGRALFYWLIESENNPKTDPIIVWFQGGPGCSGLLGLFTENGPFVPDNQGGLQYNPLSWTKFATVVYFEQPAGVGFSYSNTSSDYNTDDHKSAVDNFNFLELFLSQNPEYSGNKVYLAGESYAGVYVPSVTYQIVLNSSSLIYKALGGLTVGNPVISCQSADYTAIQFNLFYWHGLVSHTIYANWVKSGCDQSSQNNGCSDIYNTAVSQIGVIYQQLFEDKQDSQPSLDPDDLYQDFCTGNGTLEFTKNTGYPSKCNPVGNRLATYLNRKDVQTVMGVVPATWQECSSNINYNTSGASMIPLYKTFFDLRPDLDILIYSGDVDIATVPFGYTAACIYELQQESTIAWQPWFVNGATAGYVETYDHFTFATIKGAGHESPQYQPLSSWEMEKSFVQTGSLPIQSNRRWDSRLFRRSQGMVLRELGIKG